MSGGWPGLSAGDTGEGSSKPTSPFSGNSGFPPGVFTAGGVGFPSGGAGVPPDGPFPSPGSGAGFPSVGSGFPGSGSGNGHDLSSPTTVPLPDDPFGPPGQSGSRQGAVPEQSGTAASETASTPLTWLLVALGLVIGSVLLFFLTQGATFGLVGWLMGGPLAIGALAMFMLADTKSRSNPWFTANPVADPMRRGVAVAALLAVGLSAYHVAADVARGIWT